MNTVRYLGKQRLGLSCGLVGTGMAFTRDPAGTPTMDKHRASCEDGEYHMRLVLAGERVEFVADASVSSAMPTSLRGSSDSAGALGAGKACS